MVATIGMGPIIQGKWGVVIADRPVVAAQSLKFAHLPLGLEVCLKFIH